MIRLPLSLRCSVDVIDFDCDVREETALGGHISAVMWLDDLEVKARHADDLDVVSSKRLLDISLSSDLSTETFVEFYGCFKIICGNAICASPVMCFMIRILSAFQRSKSPDKKHQIRSRWSYLSDPTEAETLLL